MGGVEIIWPNVYAPKPPSRAKMERDAPTQSVSAGVTHDR